MVNKWYDSEVASLAGWGLFWLGVGLIAGASMKGSGHLYNEDPRLKRELILQEADLNGNNIPDKFYSINGEVAIVELDGKSIEWYKRE